MALGKLRQKTSRRPLADSAGPQISPPPQILALPCPACPARAKKQSLQKVTPGKGGPNGSARLTAWGTGGEGPGPAFLSSGAHRQTAPTHTDVSRGFLRSPFPSWPGRAYSCPQGPWLVLGKPLAAPSQEGLPSGRLKIASLPPPALWGCGQGETRWDPLLPRECGSSTSSLPRADRVGVGGWGAGPPSCFPPWPKLLLGESYLSPSLPCLLDLSSVKGSQPLRVQTSFAPCDQEPFLKLSFFQKCACPSREGISAKEEQARRSSPLERKQPCVAHSSPACKNSGGLHRGIEVPTACSLRWLKGQTEKDLSAGQLQVRFACKLPSDL